VTFLKKNIGIMVNFETIQSSITREKLTIKVKPSLYRPGEALRVPWG
jgi:hypothetical protein